MRTARVPRQARTAGWVLAVTLVIGACGPAGPAARPTPAGIATAEPSPVPTAEPSPVPTAEPSPVPTAEPSQVPTTEPSEVPTTEPSEAPTTEPSEGPTAEPSPTASATAGVIDDDFSDVPPGDQPIGFKFPPAPSSFADLRVPNGHGAQVYLTFDDGPSPYTKEVLAALAEVHAPAVFCLVGDNAVDRPADVRAEIDAGHSLCDHSRDHLPKVGGSNRATVKAEIAGGLREIRSVAGDAPVRYYRQPFGYWTPLAVDIMYAAGLNPLRWTADPLDWSRPGKVAIAQRVLLRLRPGAIVLMHDGGGNRSQTVAALRWLLPHLRDAGWTFALAPVRHLPRDEAARQE